MITPALRIISIFSLLLLFQECYFQQERSEPTAKEATNSLSPLAAYGRAVFEREACLNCHVLSVEKATANLISLDGSGEIYPDLWLYSYLTDPQAIIPDSKKPSYQELNERPLERSFWEGSQATGSWTKLLAEAKAIEANIEAQSAGTGLNVEQTEMLALIAYLQQIPRSKEQQRRDSLEPSTVETDDWRAIRLDSMKPIIELAAQPESQVKGKVLFEKHCSPCHGDAGQGIIGPNLTDAYWLHGGTAREIAQSISYGVPEKGMLVWKNVLRPEEIANLLAYVQSIQGSQPENPKAAQGEKE